MIGRVKKEADRYAFEENSKRIGSPCRVDPDTVPLDEWHLILDENGKENGMCKRTRMRTLNEVFKDLHERLDVFFCEKCGHERKRRKWTKKDGQDLGGKCQSKGCDGEYRWFIDEYFSGPRSDALIPHDFRWIACYPVTGGSEGHYVHVDFMCPVETIIAHEGDFGEKKHEVSVMRESIWKPVRLALGKTFRGMDHAAEMAKRCAKLLGA